MMMTFWYYRPDDIQSQNPTTECVGVSCIPMACKDDASKQNLLLQFNSQRYEHCWSRNYLEL